MKKYYLQVLLALLLSLPAIGFAQVGIGTETPHASAQLEIQANGKGVLIPRVTQANRPADRRIRCSA